MIDVLLRFRCTYCIIVPSFLQQVAVFQLVYCGPLEVGWEDSQHQRHAVFRRILWANIVYSLWANQDLGRVRTEFVTLCAVGDQIARFLWHGAIVSLLWPFGETWRIRWSLLSLVNQALWSTHTFFSCMTIPPYSQGSSIGKKLESAF